MVVGEICGIQSNTLPVAGSSPYGPRSTLYEQSVPITARPARHSERKKKGFSGRSAGKPAHRTSSAGLSAELHYCANAWARNTAWLGGGSLTPVAKPPALIRMVRFNEAMFLSSCLWPHHPSPASLDLLLLALGCCKSTPER